MDSGVATRPLADIKGYRDRLAGFMYRSGTVMQPVFAAAAGTGKKIAYAEGEDDRVLRAVQAAVDERLARPILVGRPGVILDKIRSLGLRMEAGRDFDIASLDDDALMARATEDYYVLRHRRGLSHREAEAVTRRNATLVAALLLRSGEADGMLCGTVGTYADHLKHVSDVVGRREGVSALAAMHLLMLPRHTIFVCDTYINVDPSAEELTEFTLMAAEEVRRFDCRRAWRYCHIRISAPPTRPRPARWDALALLQERAPDLEIDGEMHADAALSRTVLNQTIPDARLSGAANLLIMPNLDAANITFNALKVVSGEGVTVGPILLGTARPAHILTPTSTVRRILNMTALTAVDAAVQR